MAENKTKATLASPQAYIDAIADESRRQDCAALMALMARATRLRPPCGARRLWDLVCTSTRWRAARRARFARWAFHRARATSRSMAPPTATGADAPVCQTGQAQAG